MVAGSADRPLTVGDVDIECYVLEDGTRLITQASFMRAIGRTRFPSGGRAATTNCRCSSDHRVPPFITKEITDASQPTFNGLVGVAHMATAPNSCQTFASCI